MNDVSNGIDRTKIDLAALVGPEFLNSAIELEARMAEALPPTIENIPAIREMPAPYDTEPLSDIDFFESMATVKPGHPDVKLYVINAKPGTSRPAILHTHGGGQYAGSAKRDIRRLQDIARQLDCVIITVEYRLAPEATYKMSVEDDYAGLRWLHEHAEELGIDPDRVALMGESAGGTHAALLAFAARDRGEFPVAFQCLIYPMLDDRTGTTRPVPDHIGSLVWTPELNAIGWQYFLGSKPGDENSPIDAVPGRRTDLRGLPPTFIGIGALDLFIEESIDFASRLICAGVRTELFVVPGGLHGFDIFAPDTVSSKHFAQTKINALRRGLGIADPA